MRKISQFVLLLSFFVFASVASAALKVSPHVGHTSDHLVASLSEAKSGNSTEFVAHAKAALVHLTAAQKDLPGNQHIDVTLTHLNEAIKVGEKGDTVNALVHGKEAKRHLDMI